MSKLTAQEIIMEYLKCVVDPIHAIETYLSTQDVTSGGYVPFRLFPKQKELVNSYEKFQKTIATKSRQAGVTTTTAAYCAVKCVLAPKNSPEKVVIITNKLDSSMKILDQVREFILQLTEQPWLTMDINNPNPYIKKIESPYSTDSKKELVLAHNNSSVKAISSGKDSSRTLTATYLIFDEAGFIENGDIIYTSALPLISTGGKVAIISTANGKDLLYWPIYQGSKKTGKEHNGFNLVEMRWYQDPRFNKDLEWIKPGEENIVEKDFTMESFQEKIDNGYKPTSTWYRSMVAGYSGNTRAVAQELDVDFLNSGGNVISEEAQKTQREKNMIEKPMFEDPEEPDMWIWKTPDETYGKRMLMSVDPASGSGADFSAIEILNVDYVDEDGNFGIEQVAQYYGKMRPDDLAELAYKYAEIYDCFVVIDGIGGYGFPIITKFMDLNYKKLYKDSLSNPVNLLIDKNKMNRIKDSSGKPAGWHNPANRPIACTRAAAAIENNIMKLRSIRTIKELETWIWNGNKMDHSRSSHDDSIMALAMAIFVFENAFTALKISASDISANLAIFSGGSYNIVKGSRKQVEQQKAEVNKLDEKRVLPGLFTVSYGTQKNDDYGFLYGMENYGRRR